MRACPSASWLGLVLASCIALPSTVALAQAPESAPAAPAAPPAYAYPPPGYYPPPAYPPPGYPPPGYPPPGYPPPPQYAQAPAAPGYMTGFLGMPYLGLHIPLGDADEAFGTGFRIGGILGGRIMPMLSLNGEITLDIMNPKDVPSGMDVSVVMADVLFSPLLHFGAPSIDVFFGPKLGAFVMAESISYEGEELKATAQGLAYGINVGVAVPVGNIAVGGIISYVGRHATEACVEVEGLGEECDDSPSGDDFKTLSILGTVMF